MGCHHAREWIAIEVPYLLAAYLVSHADQDSVQQWLTQGEIWVVPMVNPDGHEFSRTEQRLWRKNRHPNPDGSLGVDPNRNYGHMWGTLDIDTSSHVPEDPTYVGPHAFSEPETRAVRDLIRRELFRGVITYHSYSQLILYPWVTPRSRSQRRTTIAGWSSLPNLCTHPFMRRTAESIRLSNRHNCTRQRVTRRIGPTVFIKSPHSPSNYAHRLGTRGHSSAFSNAATWEENQPTALEFIQQVL